MMAVSGGPGVVCGTGTTTGGAASAVTGGFAGADAVVHSAQVGAGLGTDGHPESTKECLLGLVEGSLKAGDAAQPAELDGGDGPLQVGERATCLELACHDGWVPVEAGDA